uniref:Uncharacterized protein n=1 Tax=Rhizophora mucronata TaxID=61149 RepID=A0A2P2QHQ2_RHIMU
MGNIFSLFCFVFARKCSLN